MPTFDTIAPGTKPIAAYQPIFELGRGGMGTVHLARAVGAGGFERLVVVKRLKEEMLEYPEAVQRFLDEARQAALIHHANVVGIHQIGRDAKGYFLVLDYVEGSALDALVGRAAQRNQRIPASIVLRIALDALAGLSAAHRATDPSGRPLNLLHRDVSAQNVLVGHDGVTRLADFGVAKSALASVQTDQRYIVGKLMYLPPEYLGRQPVGPTLDIYSLGVTLWTAFAGGDPWPDASEAELVTRICQERLPSLSEVGVRVAPQIEALVMRACDPDPGERFQSARAMADEIEAMARETGWVASHAEVAELLDDLIGSDLSRRRERVASVVASLPTPDTQSEKTHRSVPPSDVVLEPTRRVAREDEGTKAIPFSVRKLPLPILVGAGAVMLAGALYFAIGRANGDRAEVPDPGASAPSSAKLGAAAEPTAPSPQRSAFEPPTSAPAPGRVVQQIDSLPLEDSPAPSAAARAAPSKLPKPRTELRAEPAVRPASPPPSASPVIAPAAPRAPDGISKSNPYR
jgi:eukaryotic-like serine/threonine-protein kinase